MFATASEFECVQRYRARKTSWNNPAFTPRQREYFREVDERIGTTRAGLREAADIAAIDMEVKKILPLDYMCPEHQVAHKVCAV